MGKILFWIVLIAVAWGAVRLLIAQGRKVDGATQPEPSSPEPEAMLQCAFCRVHFPGSEAVSGSASRVYCSPAHRNAAGDDPRS